MNEMLTGLMQDDFPLTLQHVLRRARTINSDRRIVSAEQAGVRTATYGETAQRIDRLCSALTSLGVGIGDRVATLAWNTLPHFEVYLAVPAMGAVLHTVNLRLHADQLTYILNHGGARVLVVDASLFPLYTSMAQRLDHVEHVVVIDDDGDRGRDAAPVATHDYEQLLAAGSAEFDYPVLDDRAASGLCYTSGTTSDPRGVLYSHRSTVLHALTLGLTDTLGIGSRDTVLMIVPMFHANGWGLAHAAPLFGANLVLPGRWTQPARIAQLLEEQQVTISGAVPTVWMDLVRHLEREPANLAALHTVSCGGAPAPRSLLESFDRLGVDMVHAWGMTELSPLGSVARPPAEATGEAQWPYRTSQGRALPLLDTRLVGPDGDVPFDGVSVGEVLLRGPWVAAAYYDDDNSSDRFVDGWLRTGDIATITPDGYIRLVDRAKDLIKSGGEWISSVELENQLMDHADVCEACVVGRPDERWTERPVAYVVAAEGRTVDVDDLREHLTRTVARWWVPDEFVVIEAIPKTSVGKFDKKSLRARHTDPLAAPAATPVTR